jgi:prephenate dehydrogenase
MGGSLARALSAHPKRPRRIGWSPVAAERAEALEAGALDHATDGPEEAVDGADLVVLAAPLEATCRLIRRLADALGESTVLTDVASLKVPVREAVRSVGLEAAWVGSHPMCGSETSGFAASRADLYQRAGVYLVSSSSTDAPFARISSLWRDLGAAPRSIDAQDHDALMAAVSHLPQVTANLLGRVLAGAGIRAEDLGPAGRDMTRLASSSPVIWRDILAHGPPELAAHLRTLARRASDFADLVEGRKLDTLTEWMEGTRAWRDGS